MVLDEAGFGKRLIPLPATPVIMTLRLLEAFRLSPLYNWIYETAATDSYVSIEKAMQILGFLPKFSNRMALIRNYRWFVQNVSNYQNTSGITHRAPWKQGVLGILKRCF